MLLGLRGNFPFRGTDNEWIEIENKSKKKINLKGWSIATGSEKIVNHPIKKDFKIKAGKTKKLDRKDCAFTLGNKKTKIELRDPSGKVVQKIKYDRKDNSIRDDEIYEKNEDGWEWIEAQKDTENPLLPLGEGARRADEGTSAEEKLGSNILKEEILANLGKYTISSDWENKKEKQIKLVYFNSKIKTPEIIFVNQPRVLGAKILKIQGNQYLFTKPENEKHWAVELSENSWTKTNSFLNYLILNARL